MKKVANSIIAAIVFLSVLFFIGRLVFLSGVQKEISQTQNRLTQLEEKKGLLEAELVKLRARAKQEIKSSKKSAFLIPGQEHTLLTSILACTGNLRIQNYELMKSYFVKSQDDESLYGSSSASFNTAEQLPELDDQGMPVGATMEEDTEWPGVEIIPIKLSFSTTYRNLGKFFSKIDKNLPINVVRSMDVLIKDSAITKGTIVMLFPVTEK